MCRNANYLIVAMAVFVTAFPVGSSAQTGTNSNTKQQQNEAKKARETLQEDGKQLAQAEHRVAEAMARVKRAVKQVETAEKDATERLEKKLGIDKMNAELDDIHHKLKDASVPVIEKLHQTEAYRKAREKLDEVKHRLTQLKSADTPKDDLRPTEKAVAEGGQALRDLEHDAIKTDPSTKNINERHLKLEAEETDLYQKLHQSLDDESDVMSAHNELDHARDEFRDAKKSVSMWRMKVGQDQAHAAKEQEESEMAQMLDRLRRMRNFRRGGRRYR